MVVKIDPKEAFFFWFKEKCVPDGTESKSDAFIWSLSPSSSSCSSLFVYMSIILEDD